MPKKRSVAVVVKRIEDRIAKGQSLRWACREEGVPEQWAYDRGIRVKRVRAKEATR